LISEEATTSQKLTVFIDNQAAIQSTERPRNQSGQMILGIIRRNIKMLTDRGVVVTLRWIPAHTGVKCNEEVDLLAKLATGWKPKEGPIPTFTTSQYAWIPQLVSSCKRTVNTRMERYRYACWYAGKTGILYRKRYPDLDSKINNLYNNLIRTQSSGLIQMRTEKIGLNDFLYRISRAETA